MPRLGGADAHSCFAAMIPTTSRICRTYGSLHGHMSGVSGHVILGYNAAFAFEDGDAFGFRSREF
jgi:hypothetical protein